MSDRELLEKAAKAAGIEVIRSRLDDPLCRDLLVRGGARNLHHELGPWNPLTDDGDALRLAVTLRINIEHAASMSRNERFVSTWPSGRGDCGFMEKDLGDYAAATRLAILRAAAAMAEGGKE